MKAGHLEILVEEPSMEAFLLGILPKLLGKQTSFQIYPFQGKDDLLNKLPARLRGYAAWLPATMRLVVLVDRDDDDCARLKGRIEKIGEEAGLQGKKEGGQRQWQIVTRIAIEELEAWYFGDWDAVRSLYPKVKKTVAKVARYRDSDAISGGTWEAFERLLQKAGYFKNGLRKIEVDRALGREFKPSQNRSPSFQVFCRALLEAVESTE